MAKHSTLQNGRAQKKDEFYTMREDIENELSHYEKHFKNKTVYCNCDDPETSEFWQFFKRNFRPWELKKLIATHYEPDKKNYSYMLEISEDTNGDGVVDWKDEPTVTQIQCNGDFRSAYCVELLKQSDIVVTNPPFSLFREYVAQLIQYNKKFLIIGNVNAITYKEIFPLIKDNKIWIGYKFNGKPMKFIVPDYYPLKGSVCGYTPEGKKYIGVGGTCWFTNLDIPKRHTPLDLRGNYYHGNEEKYPHYDNYDAINVDKTDNIPCDYDGVMGVPITFLDKYCPEQFEILNANDFRRQTTPIKSTMLIKDKEAKITLEKPIDTQGQVGDNPQSVSQSVSHNVCQNMHQAESSSRRELTDGTSTENVNTQEFSYGSYDDMVSRPICNGIKIYRRIFIRKK